MRTDSCRPGLETPPSPAPTLAPRLSHTQPLAARCATDVGVTLVVDALNTSESPSEGLR
jgi:hypothetical protein